MRVLLACPYAWDAPGGVQVHVRGLASYLRGRGHQVLVIAPGGGTGDEPWVQVMTRPIRVPYRGTVAPIGPSPVSFARIRAVIRNFAPDVVHVHEPLLPSTSMYATLASPKPVPVVATFHAFADGSWLLRAAAPLVRPVWRRIARPLAVSEAAASYVSGPFRPRPAVVPNGVDVNAFADAEPSRELPDGPKLLWVNRLDPQKGFPVAVRAFELLAEEFGDLRFVVAGDGADRAAPGALAPGVRERVSMLGAVDHARLPAVFAACDVFVSPAAGQESFGIVLVEAMAAGLPVVATDIPGYREVVRNGVEGLLVAPGDAPALAEAVGSLLRDPGRADKLGRVGRARAGAFAWDVVGARIEAIYEELATTRQARRTVRGQ